jgi:hypothetical protein
MGNEQQLPYGISEYIKEHFREDFLFDVKEVRQVKGHSYYTVEISKDNFIHTITFNERGEVMTEQTDQAFPPDIHDEPTF